MPRQSYTTTVFLGLVSFFLVICLIFFPERAFNASLQGLEVWWEVVFPALLPFFITSEILMGFGVVHFLGVLLEPFMRPVFNIPGAGGFVLSMGLASGYPIGAKLTARLREQDVISRSEGERLVSFANTADPLFMFGAVAVGFFHDVTLGVTLAIAHYTSCLIVGLVMRFHDTQGEKSTLSTKKDQPLLVRGIKEMHKARLNDGRTFGQLMGDAILSSVNTLMMIGGFIIMFSVILNIMNLTNVTTVLSHILGLLFIPLGLPMELAGSFISGFFEITLGAQAASETPGPIGMNYKMAVVSAVVAWSGMSVHCQVASILSSTDIRYKPYFWARILHALVAGTLTLLLWNPIQHYVDAQAIPTFFQQVPQNGMTSIWDRLSYLGGKMALFLAVLCLIGLCYHFMRRMIESRK